MNGTQSPAGSHCTFDGRWLRMPRWGAIVAWFHRQRHTRARGAGFEVSPTGEPSRRFQPAASRARLFVGLALEQVFTRFHGQGTRPVRCRGLRVSIPSFRVRVPCSQLLDVLGRGAEPFPSPPSQARSFARSSLVKLGRAQGRSVAKGCWQVARRCRAQSWARRCRAATVSDVYRHKSAAVATRQRRVQPGTATPCPKAYLKQGASQDPPWSN